MKRFFAAVSALVALAAGVVAVVGPAREWWEDRRNADPAERVVGDFYDARLERRYTDAYRLLSDRATKSSESEQIDRWMGDRLVFRHVAVRYAGTEDGTARVDPVDDVVVRTERGGCYALRGGFDLRRIAGEWRIDRLPKVARSRFGSCSRAQLRRSWTGPGVRRDGVPPAALHATLTGPGGLQRVDALRPQDDGHATETASLRARAAFTVDRNGDGPVTPTAWLSAPGSARLRTLTYTFAAPVELAAVRLHNGMAVENAFRTRGRLFHVELGTDDTRIDVLLPDTPDRVVIACPLGVTARLTLTVKGIYPAQGVPAEASDAALGHIEFWGAPAFPEDEVVNAPAGMMVDATTAPGPDERVATCDTDVVTPPGTHTVPADATDWSAAPETSVAASTSEAP